VVVNSHENGIFVCLLSLVVNSHENGIFVCLLS
jgi:hypothetical protein